MTSNHRAALFAAMYCIVFPAVLLCQSIRITSPSPGVSWDTGKSYTITWVKSGSMKELIKIRLFDGSGTTKMMDVVNSAPNNGRFQWTVPRTVSSGQYTIRVRTVDGAVLGLSEPFTIRNKSISENSPVPGSVPSPTPQPPPGTSVSQPGFLATAAYDFSITQLTRDHGNLWATVKNDGKKAFNGLLPFRIQAMGHDNTIPISLNLPAGESRQVDLIWQAYERDIFESGNRSVLTVTANPTHSVLEGRYDNNTAKLILSTHYTAWIDDMSIQVIPQFSPKGTDPFHLTARITVRARGNGPVKIKYISSNGGRMTRTFYVSSPSTYADLTQTFVIQPLSVEQLNRMHNYPTPPPYTLVGNDVPPGYDVGRYTECFLAPSQPSVGGKSRSARFSYFFKIY